jgi:Peptide arylation enzymes
MSREWLESLVLGDVLRSRAETHGNAPFLTFRDGELTFADVDVLADRYARGLAAEGVEAATTSR